MSRSLTHLHGYELESVSYDRETYEWVFQFNGRVVLQLSCAWRVLSAGRIAIGHNDDGHQFGLPARVDAPKEIRALIGSQPVSSAITNDQGDLQVGFGEHVTLQAFNDSLGYEGWQLSGPGKRHVIGGGGGDVTDSEMKG